MKFNSSTWFVITLLVLSVLLLWETTPWAIALPGWFLTYALFAFLMARLLGRCPLRWRGVAIWVVVILVAHAWWIILFRYILSNALTGFNWWRLSSSVAGIVAGIMFALWRGFQTCSCSLTSHQGNEPYNAGEKYWLSDRLLITHNPVLPAIIARTFGWKTISLNMDGGWHAEAICTGRSLVSLPHFSYGAVWSDSPAARRHDMENSLRSLHFDRGFNGIEVRLQDPGSTMPAYKTASWLPLANDPAVQRARFTSNLRRKINKAQRLGYEVKKGGGEFLSDFYRVYGIHMQSLGTGTLPERFFRNLIEQYNPGVAEIFIVSFNGSTVGAAFNLGYNSFYENCWFATLHSVQPHYVSYLLHDAMIEHAIRQGYSTYSFGRSTTGSGVHRFKQQWGGTDIPLEWIHWPKQTLNIRRFNFVRELWRYVPPPFSNWIGGYIAKWIY